MGARGRLPLPDSVHRVRGHRSNRKPKRDPVAAPKERKQTDLVRPGDLDAKCVPWWDEIVRECRGTGMLRQSDSMAVWMLSDSLERFHRLANETRGQETMLDDKTGRLVVNPKYTIMERERRAMRPLFDKLGLTPASRIRLMSGTRDPDLPPVNPPKDRERESVSKYLD